MNFSMLNERHTVAIFKVSCPVTNLGYGRRIAFWTAGCDIGCAGCCSRDSWEAKGRRFSASEMAIMAMDLVRRHGPVDGITLSGGEPSLWAEGLSRFLTIARREMGAIDVLLYSGLPWRKLERTHAELLSHCDAVIPEPYVHGRASAHPLLGSENQTLRCLTSLGRARYLQPPGTPAGLHATVQEGVVNLTGVPKGETLSALKKALERHNLQIQSASWEST